MCEQRPKFQEAEVIKVHLGHPQGWGWSWCRPLEVVRVPLEVRHHRRPAVEDCHLPVGGGGDLLIHVVTDDDEGDHLLIGGGGDPLVHEGCNTLSRV